MSPLTIMVYDTCAESNKQGKRKDFWKHRPKTLTKNEDLKFLNIYDQLSREQERIFDNLAHPKQDTKPATSQNSNPGVQFNSAAALHAALSNISMTSAMLTPNQMAILCPGCDKGSSYPLLQLHWTSIGSSFTAAPFSIAAEEWESEAEQEADYGTYPAHSEGEPMIEEDLPPAAPPVQRHPPKWSPL